MRDAGFTDEQIELIIAENKGYEIIVSISRMQDLKQIAAEFLRRSSTNIYDERGRLIPETEEEYNQRNPWPGAWDVPVLIIGGARGTNTNILGFKKAYLFRFSDKEKGEYNFVINQRVQHLKDSKQYGELISLGFCEEPCLGNIRFIKDYVDFE